MTACTQLQACSNTAACTNTEAGLSLAQSHIKPASQGGAGREHTNKIVVLLDRRPAQPQQSSNTTITNYVNANPSTWTNPSTGQVTNNWSVTGGYTYRATGGPDADLGDAEPAAGTSMRSGWGWTATPTS